MDNWKLGTIGFNYSEWKISFYPAGQPTSQQLNFYSKAFDAVEINTTFYGPQSPTQVERWAASTPGGFRFCLKTPRRITHDLRLQSPGAEEMRTFIHSSTVLGQKLGPFLVQLPPSFKPNEIAQLELFLQSLSQDKALDKIRYAVEFRHASWYQPEIVVRLVEILKKYQAAWVSTDYEDLPMRIIPTTDFFYIRWIGKHGVIPHTGKEVIDRTSRLQEWVRLIQQNWTGIHSIYGFFDNDYAGHSPATCSRFKEMIGLPATQPPAGQQGRLF